MRRALPALVLMTIASVNEVHAEGVTFLDEGTGAGVSIDESTQATPLLSSNKLVRIWEDIDPGVTYAVNSNVLYMHRCTGSSCTVRRAATTNSSAVPDQSTIVCRNGSQCAAAGQGTLSAFSRGDSVWNNTMACVREVFAPFGITVTDSDPGSAAHYEIMVGGTPGQLGFDSNTGGVSPATCGEIPSSLVFVFDVWGTNVNDICSTAAQEIAHSWALDHVTEPSDPMTYFPFASRRRFVNSAITCGSDCVNGQGPFGETCSGTNNQVRACACGGTTQNSVQMIKNLFGDGTPTPPSVAISIPTAGQTVNQGFQTFVDATDDMGIGKIELYIDNVLIKSAAQKPYNLLAPTDLAEGPHEVKVIAYDVIGAPDTATVNVVIASSCVKPADCPSATDTCIGGRCVPGPGVQGGLGMECSDSSQCASGQCAMTTDGAYCVEDCVLDSDQCPSGFGCLDTGGGTGNGVCFPGYEPGGCDAGGGGAPITAGLGFAALLFARRRRRS
ncbi:MAG: Ig-like domain-containing protein [Deltaproteobacteria bacterium]|nr:Ig-like domain-containing protein [Deltaproteobacteria bacterium]